MTSLLLTDIDKLRSRLDDLQNIVRDLEHRKNFDSGELAEAIAEGSFRLALHPQSAPEESFQMLYRAIRLDGTNPKFSYHIARLYFAYGQFDLAADWLREAMRLSPTSHRIWTHISLLQKELEATYHGNPEVEHNVLRKRSNDIVQAISNGTDEIQPALADFVPPVAQMKEEEAERQGRGEIAERLANPSSESGLQSQARIHDAQPTALKRLTNPGTCRWSGVHDLAAEWLLEGLPTQANLSKLLPLLKKVADAAPTRSGGYSAFAILGIQWIISDYPVAPVQELRNTLFKGLDHPVLQLLDRVCQIYQADEKELPSLLANALSNNEIPPALAAIIHQRRLFWAPLEIKSLGTYHQAKKILRKAQSAGMADDKHMEENTKAINDCVRRLDAAMAALQPQRPPALQYKSAGEPQAIQSADDLENQLMKLSEIAGRLPELRDQVFFFLKTNLDNASKDLSDVDVYSQAVADRDVCNQLKFTLKQAGNTGLEQLDKLFERTSTLNSSNLPPDFETRKEKCKKNFAELSNLGNFDKVLTRIDQKLKLFGEHYVLVIKVPSADLANIQSDLGKIFGHFAETDDSSSTADQMPHVPLMNQANEILAGMDERWKLLKELVAAHKAGALSLSQTTAGAEIADYTQDSFAFCERALKETEEIRKNGKIAQASVEQVNQTEKMLLVILTRRGAFSKNLALLPKQPTTISSQTEKVDSPRENPPIGDPQANAQSVSKPLTGLDRLQSKVEQFELQIGSVFDKANATFEPYPNWVKRYPPLRALRMTVRAHEAETYYRMGRYKTARRIWNSMFAENRLDADIMKNIALCDTHDGDLMVTMSAWKNYTELLYMYDVAADDLYLHAQQRVDFHRAMADSYGPRTLAGKVDEAWFKQLDKAAFLTFFVSPGRVRSFVNHKLLEILNMKLNFRSPLMILGVTRSEGIRVKRDLDEAARQAAAVDAEPVRKLTNFVLAATETLPERVCQGYQELCKQRIAQAAIQCSVPELVSTRRDPEYGNEEPRQIKWVEDIVELKYKFHYLLQKRMPNGESELDHEFISEFVQHMTSIDWLGELVHLDKVPVDLSQAWIRPAVKKYGMKDSEELVGWMKDFCDTVVTLLLQFIFAGGKGSTESLRQQQYQRLVTDWVKRPAFYPYVEVIDDPQRFYIAAVQPCFEYLNGQQESMQGKALIQQAITTLQHWHTRYPELTGPSKLLAQILTQIGRHQDAIKVLDQASLKGFNISSLPTVYFLRMQIWSNQANHFLSKDKINEKDMIEGINAVEKMCRDADVVLQRSESKEENETALDYRTIASARYYMHARKYDDALQSLKMIKLGKLNPEKHCAILSLRYQIHYGLATEHYQAHRGEESKRELEQAYDDAQRVIEIASDKDSEIVTSAEQFCEEIEKILKKG